MKNTLYSYGHNTTLAITIARDIIVYLITSYIDPETIRNVFSSPISPLLGWIVAGLLAVLWPLRILLTIAARSVGTWTKRTKTGVILMAALSLGSIIGGLMGWFGGRHKFTPSAAAVKARAAAPFTGVIVLGMDGLDPAIIEKMMLEGMLPNFSRLRRRGGYSRLATSNPPESPVAWSSIATGCEPGEHGIFDFLHRDPKTYLPYLSLRKASQGLSGTKYENARLRDGFWAYSSEAGVPTSVIRWPVAFPAETVNGRFLSGFGVPDLLGGEGRYVYFTSAPVPDNDPSPRNIIRLSWDGKTTKSAIQGPGISKDRNATLDFLISRTGTNTATIKVEDAPLITMTLGKWSEWVPLNFKCGFTSVTGNIKFMLSELDPHLRLSTSPIHMDAERQAFAITCPECFGAELKSQLGVIHTLGMPEQVHPLSHQRYDYEAFLEECSAINSERKKMLELELRRFTGGVLAFVFDTSDRVQHAFWSMQDELHPAYDPVLAARYAQVIPDVYRDMDAVLGSVLERIDNKTVLIVLSDHGFNSFRRAVHLNRWLIENDYMALSSGNNTEGRQIFQDVDWSRTKAYAMGFASVYINQAGREREGIVPLSEAHSVNAEIAAKLRNWKDPRDGSEMIQNVYIGSEQYHGPAANDGPDLIVGLKPGYRYSWQTALGGAPLGLVEDNKKRWSGDHLIDPTFVPGILFCSQSIINSKPNVTDIAPTVLKCLGVKAPAHMAGTPLF